MSEEVRVRISGWVFWTSLAVSIALLVTGFLMPPPGIIHPSVLTAVGELFAFAALGVGFEALRMGRSLRIQKGDMVAEISRKHKFSKTDTNEQVIHNSPDDMGGAEEGVLR